MILSSFKDKFPKVWCGHGHEMLIFSKMFIDWVSVPKIENYLYCEWKEKIRWKEK